MNRPLVLFLLLLTFFIPSYALFDVKAYLFENESLSDVSYVSFSIGEDAYQIVYVKGMPAFLLRNGNLVQGLEDIKHVIVQWYMMNYSYSINKSKLSNLIDAFNISRFNNDNRYLFEEGKCRYETMEKFGRPSQGELNVCCGGDIFLYWAKAVASSLGITSRDDLFYIRDALEEFHNLTYSLDSLVGDALLIVDSLTNLYSQDEEKLESLLEILDEINNTSQSLLVAKVMNIREVGYLGLCAVPNYDYVSLDKAFNLTKEALANISKIKEAEDLAEKINNESSRRVFLVFSKQKTEEINNILSFWERDWNKTKEEVEDVLKRVYDKNLSNLTEIIDNELQEIKDNVANNEFEDIDEKVSNLTDHITEAKMRLKEVSSLLRSFDEKVSSLDLVLSILEEKTLTPEEVKVLSNITSEFAEIKSETKAKVSVQTFKSFLNETAHLLEEAVSLLERVNRRESLPKGVSRAFINLFTPLYKLISFNLPFSERERVISYVPLAFSVLSFFIIFSLFSLLFTVYYVSKYSSLVKTKALFFGVSILISLVVATASAVGTYFTLSGDLFNKKVDSFVFEGINPSRMVTVIYTSNVPEVVSCTENVSQVLQSIGKEVREVYYIPSADRCKVGDTYYSGKACSRYIVPPYILLSLSQKEDINVTLFGELSLRVYGPRSYFDECVISATVKSLLSLEKIEEEVETQNESYVNESNFSNSSSLSTNTSEEGNNSTD